jgi:hypothetical protein
MMTNANLTIGETKTFGIVTVERLPDGYYYFTWSTEKFDHTERVHPYNVVRTLNEINAEHAA